MSINYQFSFPANWDTSYNEKNFNLFRDTINSSEIGFFSLALNPPSTDQIKKIYSRFKNKKKFVQVGIGGSSLGPECLIKALSPLSSKFHFINNVDPTDLHEQILQMGNLEDAVFYIVSKSGTTAETMAAFAIFTSLLEKKGIKENNLKDHFVFCTDPVAGDLRALSQKLEIECLDIPSNIGGRFSVLTPVGLLPALFAGIDIDLLLSGAKDMAKSILEKNDHEIHKISSLVLSAYKDGIDQTVMMPYSSKLKEFSAWFTQLWAESLGKLRGTDNQRIGLTPISSFGATDQHSQMQLFMEGPFNKLMFLIHIKKHQVDFSLDSNLKSQAPSLNKLAKHSLSKLMKAEFEGTCQALAEARRPFVRIDLDGLTPSSLGQLFILFESLTAYVGKALQINPFNQPGVEAGKRYAYEWLEK